MYCSECGSKCKKTDAFCGECGNPLEQEETKKEEQKQAENKPKQVKEKKPMSKKNKILIITALVVCALLFGGYQFANHVYSPKNVANAYIKALKNQNSDKLYTYLELGDDTTFVTKKIFKELNSDESKRTIENYTITDVTYGDGKLSATVSFKYTAKGSSSESTGQVYLTKQDKKKMVFFNNWKINNSNQASTVKDYTLNVPKGAKVTYAGVEVDSKYLSEDKNLSRVDSNYDTYVLPQVFTHKTKVVATLENGITLEQEVTPSNYNNSVTLNLTKESLSEEVSNKINEKAKEILTTLYSSAIDDKSFEEIKENFEGNDVNIEELETKYNSFKDSIASASNKLTKMDLKECSIYSLATEEGNLRIRFAIKYDYSVKYKSYFSDEEETHDDSATNYVTLVLGMTSDDYYLVEFDYLPTYFSRY